MRNALVNVASVIGACCIAYIVAPQAITAMSPVSVASAMELDETTSVLAAKMTCDNMNKSPDYECEVKGQAIHVTALNLEGGGVAALVGALAGEMLCNQMYASMEGVHFAEGWKVYAKAPDGVVVARCALDSY